MKLQLVLKAADNTRWMRLPDDAREIASRHGASLEGLVLSGSRESLDAALRPIQDYMRSHYCSVIAYPVFECPACGGSWFGRDVYYQDGEVHADKYVRCHDQFVRGCQWEGVWP